MMPSVAVIVLNWNNAPDTLECLESLSHLDYPNYRVIVVDNGSDDGSEEIIRARFPEVEVLQTGRNLGYAGGNNVGIRYALAQGVDYIAILNNDVTVAPDFLLHLCSALRERDDAGIATPLIAEATDPERVWALGSKVDWRTGTVDRVHAGDKVKVWRDRCPFEVDIASGTVMLVRREVFERVGLLDESFYLYFEETDWCLRVARAGYRIFAVPSSLVWHKVSASLGRTSPVIDYYMLRNQLRFIARNWSGIARLAVLGHTVERNLLTIAAYTVKSHDGCRLPHRNARLLALRDALLGRWGKMGPDVERVCYPNRR